MRENLLLHYVTLWGTIVDVSGGLWHLVVDSGGFAIEITSCYYEDRMKGR